MRHAFVHTVIDDHSRVAYAEVHDDETAATAVGVLVRAVAWYAARGITVERVLSDNGGAYRSFLWRDTCTELGITPKRTRPYRPQTNGKIERFHRTMADGWAYAHHYHSETERREALPGWLHEYNHHRPHSATGGKPPISRLTNLPDQLLDALATGEGVDLVREQMGGKKRTRDRALNASCVGRISRKRSRRDPARRHDPHRHPRRMVRRRRYADGSMATSGPRRQRTVAAITGMTSRHRAITSKAPLPSGAHQARSTDPVPARFDTHDSSQRLSPTALAHPASPAFIDSGPRR